MGMIERYRQTGLNFIFGWLRVLSILVVFLPFLLSIPANADDFSNIGSGNPGLKVMTIPSGVSYAIWMACRESGPNVPIVIYHEAPENFGGFTSPQITNETIQVIVDRGFHLKRETLYTCGSIPIQLFPFAANSAFTDDGGATEIMKPPVWLSGPPEAGFTLINSNLMIFTNVQQEAQMKYHLHSDEIFLGFIDGRVFFCKNNPQKVFWREQGSQKEYYYHLPRAVIDIYGVTKALQPDKDVGFVVCRKTWHVFPTNLFLAPVEDGFIEISFTNGKLVNSNE
jgi:hypothetical protein